MPENNDIHSLVQLKINISHDDLVSRLRLT